MIGRSVTANFPWKLLRSAGRFASLWCSILAGLILLALIEAGVLWLAGVQYRPKSSLTQATVRDFSVAPNARWGVSRVGYARRASGTSLEHDLLFHNLADQTVIPLDVSHLAPECAAVSPDGGSVAFAAADLSVYVWHASRSTAGESTAEPSVHLLHRAHERTIERLVFSPDGRWLASVGATYICVARYPEGEQVRQFPCSGKSISLAFCNDSRRLFTCGSDARVRVWDLTSGELVQDTALEEGGAVETALSEDGRLAIFALPDGTFSAWNTATGQTMWRQAASRGYWHSVKVSGDGRVVTAVRQIKGVFRLDLYDAKTGQSLGRTEHQPIPLIGHLVASDRRLYAWDVQGMLHVRDLNRRRQQWRFSALEWMGSDPLAQRKRQENFRAGI